MEHQLGTLNCTPDADETLQSSKVTVLGAAGGIGQPLSLLLKLNPRVSQLALYDIRLAPGTPAPVWPSPMAS